MTTLMTVVGRGARKRAAGLAILCLCALAASPEEPGPYPQPVQNETSVAVQTPETVIRSWPEGPRDAARAMIAKYGAPSRFTAKDLVWFDNDPWRETVVHRDAPQGSAGPRGKDFLEQTIVYAVPDDKIAALKLFDDRIKFNKDSGELSALSDGEDLNYLALNLADEIVAGKRSVDEARDFYAKTIKLSQSGKSSTYMDGFIFPLGSQQSWIQNPNDEPNPIEEPY